MTQLFEALDDPDIDSVWRWFEFQIALIGEERRRILRMFQPGNHIVAERPYEKLYIGFTRGDAEEFFDAHGGQLELLTMFELLATTEAILRIDFKARVAARKKDGLSRRFRKLYKENGEKVRLDEDILAAMKSKVRRQT